MRPFILFIILLILIANNAFGQTMQNILDNLTNHNLINETDKAEVIKALTEEGDTSNFFILKALARVETRKLIGNENMEGSSDSLMFKVIMAIKKETSHQQDSTKVNLLNYLSQLKSAGIITPDLYAEIKPNIDEGKYSTRLWLLIDVSQKTPYPQSVTSNATIRDKQKTNLTIEQINDAISNWKKIGILSHLNKEQFLLAKQKAVESKTDNINDVLVNFPGVIFSFDTELENLQDPYAELLKGFSKISHGIFKPTNISDNFGPPKSKVTVKLTLNNKNYSKDFRILEDWLDPAFIHFVREIVSQNKLSGQFYDLYEGGQGAYLIFLTPQQYKFLRTNKLLVFAEDIQ